MKHNLPGIYDFLFRNTPRSFRNAVHGEEAELENCVLGDEAGTTIPDAYVVWRSDCLELNFNRSSMKICTNGFIVYIGEVSKENQAAWEEFVDNYEFPE